MLKLPIKTKPPDFNFFEAFFNLLNRTENEKDVAQNKSNKRHNSLFQYKYTENFIISSRKYNSSNKLRIKITCIGF